MGWGGGSSRRSTTRRARRSRTRTSTITTPPTRCWKSGSTDGTIDNDQDAEIDGEQYYTHDANFNVTALLDDTGGPLERYHYDPYGKLTRYSPTWGTPSDDYENPYLYTGRRLDAETGLQYSRGRYYEPPLGRFINRDPIGYSAGDANLYRYVSNRPLNALDPFGYAETAPSAPEMPAVRIPGDWRDPAPGTIERLDRPNVAGAPWYEKPRGIFDQGGNQVGTMAPGEINCLAFGCGLYASVFPGPDPDNRGGKFKDLMPALGFRCYSGVSAAECEKQCGDCEDYLMLYAYTYTPDAWGWTEEQMKEHLDSMQRTYAGSDLFGKEFRFSFGNVGNIDYHVYKGVGDGWYRAVPSRKPWVWQDPVTREWKNNPDLWVGPRMKPVGPDLFEPEYIIDKACCCRKKGDKPREVLPE